MTINVRAKGGTAEREICLELNSILCRVMKQLNYQHDQITAALKSIQRNQNQSAVGGADLVNTFDFSIEIKRQEVLNIDRWWNQTLEAAERNNKIPILLYKQNRKPWKCVTWGHIKLDNGKLAKVRCEISFEDFKKWFWFHIETKLKSGEQVKL